MAPYLFWIGILFSVGVFVIPLIKTTRFGAFFSVFTQLLGAASMPFLLTEYFPSYSVPDWKESTAWALTGWALLIAGVVVAARKPTRRQRDTEQNKIVA